MYFLELLTYSFAVTLHVSNITSNLHMNQSELIRCFVPYFEKIWRLCERIGQYIYIYNFYDYEWLLSFEDDNQTEEKMNCGSELNNRFIYFVKGFNGLIIS